METALLDARDMSLLADLLCVLLTVVGTLLPRKVQDLEWLADLSA